MHERHRILHQSIPGQGMQPRRPQQDGESRLAGLRLGLQRRLGNHAPDGPEQRRRRRPDIVNRRLQPHGGGDDHRQRAVQRQPIKRPGAAIRMEIMAHARQKQGKLVALQDLVATAEFQPAGALCAPEELQRGHLFINARMRMRAACKPRAAHAKRQMAGRPAVGPAGIIWFNDRHGPDSAAYHEHAE